MESKHFEKGLLSKEGGAETKCGYQYNKMLHLVTSFLLTPPSQSIASVIILF